MQTNLMRCKIWMLSDEIIVVIEGAVNKEHHTTSFEHWDAFKWSTVCNQHAIVRARGHSARLTLLWAKAGIQSTTNLRPCWTQDNVRTAPAVWSALCTEADVGQKRPVEVVHARRPRVEPHSPRLLLVPSSNVLEERLVAVDDDRVARREQAHLREHWDDLPEEAVVENRRWAKVTSVASDVQPHKSALAMAWNIPWSRL
jgi:hypothetical protein